MADHTTFGFGKTYALLQKTHHFRHRRRCPHETVPCRIPKKAIWLQPRVCAADLILPRRHPRWILRIRDGNQPLEGHGPRVELEHRIRKMVSVRNKHHAGAILNERRIDDVVMSVDFIRDAIAEMRKGLCPGDKAAFDVRRRLRELVTAVGTDPKETILTSKRERTENRPTACPSSDRTRS